MLNAYLVDFENVHTNGLMGLKNIPDGDFVYIFYSDLQKTTEVSVQEELFDSSAQFIFYKTQAKTKNALDFQLAVVLGELVAQNTFQYISIISNDSGFDSIINHYAHYGCECRVIRNHCIAQAIQFIEEGYSDDDIKRRSGKLSLDFLASEYNKRNIRRTKLCTLFNELSLSDAEMDTIFYICDDVYTNKAELYRRMIKSFGREKGLCYYKKLRTSKIAKQITKS